MLSDAKIRTAKPKAKDYKLSDAGGLYLLIRPTGSRTWRLKYRFAKKEKPLTIGEYPIITFIRPKATRWTVPFPDVSLTSIVSALSAPNVS